MVEASAGWGDEGDGEVFGWGSDLACVSALVFIHIIKELNNDRIYG